MLEGCYYRCPIPIEKGDFEQPRFFVLAQVIEYNEMANSVRVKMHDLLHSGQYYAELFKHTIFRVTEIDRCSAMIGGTVSGKFGMGTIVSVEKPCDDNSPYYYYVKTNQDKYIKVSECNLCIEYTQMDYSPISQLKNYEFQNPSWFVNHIKVSRNLHLINNAFYGFDILAGCRAFLLPHQISTVSRCLETLPVRYMLADEVGLGKTVEACSILKILMSEQQQFKSLLILPSALISQWINELQIKFNLKASVEDYNSSLCILPLEKINQYRNLNKYHFDMVIVDETHRLLNNDTFYQTILNLSISTEHVLLLSATPIQDRNEEYRRLLALLNPEQYAQMPENEFASLVKKQQKIQQTANQQLGRLDKYDDYADIICEKLQNMADSLSDKALSRIIASIDLMSPDHGKELVSQALSYICENYRLERKVIRNRRQTISEKLASRCLYSELSYIPKTTNEMYNESGAIQTVIEWLNDNNDDTDGFVKNYSLPILNALFSSPWALQDVLNKLNISDELLISSVNTWKEQAEIELTLIDQILDEDPDRIKSRLLYLVDYIEQETDVLSNPNCKLVIFTSHLPTLEKMSAVLRHRLDNYDIYPVCFCRGMDRDSLDNSVYSFQNDEKCRIILCDETGGEGRNFQNAEQIIHIDLPWNANSLEQRIGRLDRLGRDSENDVRSVVIYAENTVEEQLFKIWNEALLLFSQSLSGLEIITGELNQLIVDALLDDYENGLADSYDDILDTANEMRESVEDEQLFDIGATLYKPLSQGIENVLDIYASETDQIFSDAMLGWGSQAGLHAEDPTKSGLVAFNATKFSSTSALQSLYIPPNWSYYDTSSIVKRTGQILGSFNRKLAATREDILFYAPGDPLYDSIIDNASACSRGRCTYMGLRDNYNYFGLVFVYNVDTSISALLDQGIGIQTLSQFKMFLPLNQIVVTIPFGSASQKISEKAILKTLSNASEQTAEHLGKRESSRFSMTPLEQIMSQNPPEIWIPTIDSISQKAYRKAYAEMKELSDLSSAKKEMQRIINGYRSECLYFDKDTSIVDEKLKIYNATLKALQSAKPVLDSVCLLRVHK